METPAPEVILVGGAALKLVIDTFKPLITDKYKEWIPVLALVLGVTWSLFFLDGEVASAIYRGISIGASAVGIHKISTMGKKKVN